DTPSPAVQEAGLEPATSSLRRKSPCRPAATSRLVRPAGSAEIRRPIRDRQSDVEHATSPTRSGTRNLLARKPWCCSPYRSGQPALETRFSGRDLFEF